MNTIQKIHPVQYIIFGMNLSFVIINIILLVNIYFKPISTSTSTLSNDNNQIYTSPLQEYQEYNEIGK